MIRLYHLEAALLAHGWCHDVLVSVAHDGRIAAIDAPAQSGAPRAPESRAAAKHGPSPALESTTPPTRGPSPALESIAIARSSPQHAAHAYPADAHAAREQPSPTNSSRGSMRAAAERVNGYVVPGIPNAHSHAFQRGMAGSAESRRAARDSFWTWRQAMYALANRIEPEDLQVLATQLFMEMLKSGYTSVAEFHYLHRAKNGDLNPGANALWDAIGAAAATAGIGLTFLPTLYQSSDFGGKPLKSEQLRFRMDTDQFLRAIQERVDNERRGAPASMRTGAAFHSLRAVPLETLQEAALALRSIDAELPVHIHVAEQSKEVAACRQATGRRPIEWLLDAGLLTEHWCLVHATHATGQELQGIAAAAATVCVSISTEANLGDGFFDAARFLGMGGRLCIGSDSQSTVCPAEELRWMEYQQRLRKKRRGVLATQSEPHVGTRLWCDAARDGARAIGHVTGVIAVGQRADWVVLDSTHPGLAGATAQTALDHVVFAGAGAAIQNVMVAGRWVIKERRHAAEDALREPFARLMRRFADG